MLYQQVQNDVKIVHTLSHEKDKNSPHNEGNNMVDKIASYALRTLSDYDRHIDFQSVELNI